MQVPGELAARIGRLEDREAIRQLVARYGFLIDDRDLHGVLQLFTPDGSFRSQDGVMNARGRAAVAEQFRGRFAALGPTNHFSHDQLIELDETDRDRATGLVNSHAEVWRNGRPMIAALRYRDVYRRWEGSWCFADRLLAFFYYVDVREYAEALGDTMRMRAYGDRRPADYPETLVSWRRYHDSDSGDS